MSTFNYPRLLLFAKSLVMQHVQPIVQLISALTQQSSYQIITGESTYYYFNLLISYGS